MSAYRIRLVLFKGWEPQMRYTTGKEGRPFWTPLAFTGFWAEPGSYSEGVLTGKRYPLSFYKACLAIQRAKRINDAGLLQLNLYPKGPT